MSMYIALFGMMFLVMLNLWVLDYNNSYPVGCSFSLNQLNEAVNKTDFTDPHVCEGAVPNWAFALFNVPIGAVVGRSFIGAT